MSDKHSAIWIPKANDPCPCESGASFGACHGSALDGAPDHSSALGALVARGIDLGFEVVQVERDSAGPNAKLRLGYAGESHAASMLVIDGARLEADPDRTYFAELIHKLGRVDPVPVPEGAWLAGDGDIEAIARVYITLHTLVGRLPVLKARLLERMTATGRTAVEVRGLGAVVYAPATSRTELDRGAAIELIKTLGGVPPTKPTAIAASLRVTHAAEG